MKCIFLGLVLTLVIGAVRRPEAHATGRILYLDESESYESRCEIQAIGGKFTRTGSEYPARGECIVYLLRGGAIQEVKNTIKWEALGKYNPATKATEENIHLLRLVRPDQPNYASIGRIAATMECGQDPWLNPDRVGCKNMYYGRSESLNHLELGGLYASNRNVPRTSMIFPAQRAALNEKYRTFLAIQQGTRQSPTTTSQGITRDRAAALAITEPRANGVAVQGRFDVKATPPMGVTGTGAEVEFSWLDAPGGQPQVKVWPLTLSSLMQGITVPAGITESRAGRWRVRARITAPKTGDWSYAVQFNLYLSNPAAGKLNPPAAGQANPQTQMIRR